MQTVDLDRDDLVLHEGDGKIRRPSKLVEGGRDEARPKKMPSPRKVVVPGKEMTGAAPALPEETSDGDAGRSATATAKANAKATNSRDESDKVPDKVPLQSDPGAPEFSIGGDSDDGDSCFEDWDEDDRKGRAFFGSDAAFGNGEIHGEIHSNGHRQDLRQGTWTSASASSGESQHSSSPFELTKEDIEICRRLDDEYERALEERDIGYNARYSSVRQTAMFSIVFLALYMLQGTIVYRELLLLNNEKNHNHRVEGLKEGEEDEFDNEFQNWSIPESLFFSIFTITTVGYGREDLPTTPSFQAYTILYIMVGIATLTIVVAQVYQCIALEASRARLSQDKQQTELRRRSGLMLGSATNATGKELGGPSPPKGPGPLGGAGSARKSSSDEIIISDTVHVGLVPRAVEGFFRFLDRAKFFFRETEVGKGASVVFPFAGLILSGACVVSLIEKWTFLESLYFAVVSLTTVGYGDYVPTKLPTIWFCIFWLPFSIGFMSMYLSHIATFYIRLSDRNIRRIERRLRRRLQKAKELAEEERAEILRRAYRGQEAEIEIVAGNDDGDGSDPVWLGKHVERGSELDDSMEHATIPMHHARSVMHRKKQEGFNMLPTSDDGANSDDETVLVGVATSENAGMGEVSLGNTGYRRRQRIIENCRVATRFAETADDKPSERNGAVDDQGSSNNTDRTMKSMRDVIRAVRNTMNAENYGTGLNPVNPGDANASKFMSMQSTQNMIDYSIFRRKKQSKKPSFALRVLVQERFAKIIAIEVAGYHSSIEIKEHTLSVTIDSMSATAEKWSVPRRARKAFRAVSFEVLYFVGEHGLITRGADALYELTPFEFHGLFSALVAAMGDADTMEGWLAKTDTLALVDLQKGVLHRSAPEEEGSARQRIFSFD